MSLTSHFTKGGEQFPLIISSDDPTAVGNNVAFRITLAQSLNLSGDYMCALQSAEFNHIGPASSVFISTSLNALIMTGSEMTNTLCVIPPSDIPGPFYWQQTSTLPIWVPLSASSIHNIEVSLTDSNGDAIPNDAAIKTRLTILIRPITLRP